MKLALVVTTLGRTESLRRLFASLRGQLAEGDRVVVVAQRHRDAVERLADEFRSDDFVISVTTSEPGAARGRNVGVAALPTGIDFLLQFPNDTTWFPAGSIARLRALPDSFTVGALTIVDETGPKFVLPEPGAPLTRWNMWSVIEMGLLVRRQLFDRVGGFDESIGTGAETPWQAGEGTDVLLRMQREGLTEDFAWLPPTTFLGGIADAHSLTATERRRKLRAYGRGLGRLVTRWRYPFWWRIAFVGGGLLFGVRHHQTHAVLDGWWVFVGRLEGGLGRTFNGRSSQMAISQ